MERLDVAIGLLIETIIEEQVYQLTLKTALIAYELGLFTASKDTGREIPLNPDEDAIRNIGLRTRVISEGTVRQARGALANDAAKLQQEVNAAINEGISQEEALHQIEDRVKKLFEDNFPKWKLERLVRDQFLVATKEGRRDGWQKAGVKYRQWRMTRDHKTAEDSKRMNGQIQPISKPYIDPKTGEKYMLPHMRPNDRCYEIPLWELPKQIKEIKGIKYAR